MSSLERIYTSLVRSGYSLLTEDTEQNDVPLSDEEFIEYIPEEYREYFVPGSAKKTGGNEGGQYHVEGLLKFPLNAWSDGTEDIEATYDYIEKQISNEMPGSSGDNGGSFFHPFAVVVQDQSNDQVVVVRVGGRGGINI